MPCPDSNAAFAKVAFTASMASVLALTIGCASAPRDDAPDAADRVEDAASIATTETSAEARATTVIERRPRDYPEIDTNETGFTITEQIRISSEVRGDYQAALDMLARDQHAHGIAMLVAVTEQAPELTAPHIDLGIAYRQAGELEDAEAALKIAAQLSPAHPVVHNELGILYRSTGRFDEARASYEKALETYPGFHFARRNLGVLCDLYLADLECALEHYEAYLTAVGGDRDVEIWIADIRNRLGREEAADGT